MQNDQKPYFNKTRTNWLMISILLIPLFIALYVQNSNRTSLIDKCPRYTIATGTLVKDKKLYYTYSIQGKSYTQYWWINPRSTGDVLQLYKEKFAGQRILLRVNCNDFEVNEFDWNRSIPDSVENAPYGGWLEIPDYFPKTKFAD